MAQAMPLPCLQRAHDLLALAAGQPPRVRVAEVGVRALRLHRPVHRDPTRGIGDVLDRHWTVNGSVYWVRSHSSFSTPPPLPLGSIAMVNVSTGWGSDWVARSTRAKSLDAS